MPDWQKFIRERMPSLSLPEAAKDEVIAELASHLEESGSDAAGETTNMNRWQWRKISRAIEHAKSREEWMNNRARGLWIPVFVNLLLTSALINICGAFGWVDLRITQPGHTPLPFQLWVLTLPLCGAAAAYLARRGKGSSRMRVLAALAPCFAWLATIPVLEVILLCFPKVFAGVSLQDMAFAAVGWFAIPALALFLGAVPFLKTPLQQA